MYLGGASIMHFVYGKTKSVHVSMEKHKQVSRGSREFIQLHRNRLYINSE